MALSVRVSVLMAAAIAAAIAVAPAAGADPRGGCDQSCPGGAPNPLDSDFAGLPQGWTNEAQFAKPGNNPFGAGPKPPILALD